MSVAEAEAVRADRDFSRVFVPGANHFELMRHLFASMVLIDHAFVLGGFGHALQRLGIAWSLGHLGVACFFVLSGGLVAASRDHCESTLEFFRNRALRIFPGYAVCLAVTALVIVPIGALAGAWLSERSIEDAFTAYLAAPGPIGYLLKNALLVQLQTGIGRVFASHPEAYAVNGALWSIPWEALCYLLVALFGAGGALARRKWLVLVALLLALGNASLSPKGSIAGVLFLNENVVLLPVYFLLGMSFYLFRSSLPRRELLGLAAPIAFLLIAGHDRALAAPLLAYAIYFWGGRRVRRVRRAQGPGNARATNDLSYGLYIYGFPLQQVLVALGVAQYGAWAMLVASPLLAVPLAWCSWRWVERPALAAKHRALLQVAQSHAIAEPRSAP